jgi:hypothetical protein
MALVKGKRVAERQAAESRDGLRAFARFTSPHAS